MVMDDKFAITLNEVFKTVSISTVRIATVADYYPWIIRTRRTKIFRFKTYTQTNGNLGACVRLANVHGAQVLGLVVGGCGGPETN